MRGDTICFRRGGSARKYITRGRDSSRLELPGARHFFATNEPFLARYLPLPHDLAGTKVPCTWGAKPTDE